MSRSFPARGDGVPIPGAADALTLLPGEELALLRSVLDALPVGVTVEHPDGGLVLANEGARTLRPVPTDEAFAAAQPARVVESSERVIGVGGRQLLMRTSTDVTDRQRLERELAERTWLDDLTGLPNRSLLERRAAELIGADPGRRFAVAFIDLDDFKAVNDHYSHAVGDALLRRIATRLTAMLRPTDMLARIGGDEFVLLICPAGTDAEIVEDVEHVVARLREPCIIEGREIFASASVGISVYPQDGRDIEALRRRADSAMYRAKSGRKGSALLYNSGMEGAATARLALEQRLRGAILDRRFCCAYQPKVDMRSGELTGVEVLLRWRDEDGQVHSAGEFVKLAVELGLMDQISLIALSETVDALDLVTEAFGAQTTISLNVAAKQAENVDFMASYIEAVAATGCAERFMLELTEEAFFSKSRFQRLVLPQMRDAGLRVSIDDFGVGYSSLAALADITADEVKVDRSFITNIHRRPRSQSILKAVASLGQALDMSIIAEGVETAEELLYLQTQTGIRYAQGYYFARPMLLEDLRSDARASDLRTPELRRESAPTRLAATRKLRLGRG